MPDWKACTEAERIENARLVRLLDEFRERIKELENEVVRLQAQKKKLLENRSEAQAKKLREVLEPLLDHYLHCYEGNHDELALNAKKLLGSP